MKIAYGTYAMPMVPLEEALPAVAKIGYDGIELAIGPKHSSMPDQWSSSMRGGVRNMLSELNLGVPSLFILGGLLTEDTEVHKGNLRLIREVAQLGRDLDLGPNPVLSMGIGGKSALWDAQREEIVRLLEDYARVASEEGFVFAGEAHVNAAVDRTDRAIWLMNTLDNPLIRLHFDIVHFYLSREPIEETVAKLVPYTAHTHVTDARIHEEGFELVLLGQGELDCTAYIRAMHKAGWTDFITVEVSAMVWSKEEYDPFAAASFSYTTLDNAFKASGVPRC